MVTKFLNKLAALFFKMYIFIRKYTEKNIPNNSSFKPYQVTFKTPIKEQRKKIIHFNGNFVVGGTSQLIVDIIENLSENLEHQVIVPEIIQPVAYQPLNILSFGIHQIKDIYRYLELNRPDIVHIHYWVRREKLNYRYELEALWYYSIFDVCDRLGIKVIQNINVPTSPYEAECVVHNVYVSNYVRENFSPKKIQESVIYPGSDFTHFKNTEIHITRNIGMVYRLDSDKLNEQSIEVFIGVAKKIRHVKCYIVGDGFFLNYYKNRVEEENLKEQFIFTGKVSYSELPCYYKKFDVFIAPVHDESFGQVVPFAMSMGLMVAGYDEGALPEILGSKNTLAKRGDSQGLVDIICSIINNIEEYNEHRRNNQYRAHKYFATSNMIEEYKKLYTSLLSN